jgi:hypothetical protein
MHEPLFKRPFPIEPPLVIPIMSYAAFLAFPILILLQVGTKTAKFEKDRWGVK